MKNRPLFFLSGSHCENLLIKSESISELGGDKLTLGIWFTIYMINSPFESGEHWSRGSGVTICAVCVCMFINETLSSCEHNRHSPVGQIGLKIGIWLDNVMIKVPLVFGDN